MNKKTSSIAFTLIIVAAILVVVNYIVGGLGFLNFRADLTEKKIFTLSDGTKKVIENLPDKPVTIRLYVTRDSRLMPQFIQSYATSVQDLLLEFEKASNGRITLEKIDPRPNTEDEDKAVADDIQGHPVNQEGDKAYFGLAIQCLDKKEILPVLNPNDEASLEYQIVRTLAKVSQTKRSVVGVMSPMPLAAPAMNFPMMQQQRQPKPWMVIEQLRQDYDVREVPMSSDAIDKDINILLVIHPSDITERAEFAIDQFVLRGGKLIAFVDPQCLVSQAYNNPGQLGAAPTTSVLPSSNLKNLFKAWGISYDPGLVVADMTYRTQSQGRPQPTLLTIDRLGINREDPITSSLDMVQIFSGGAFGVEAKDGISSTTLIQSSENSDMIESEAAEKSRSANLNTFQGSGKKRTLALRLNGKFKSAFPEGKPKDVAPSINSPKLPGGTGGAENDPNAPATAAAPADANVLKESQSEGVVFLFGDADMNYDMFAFESDQSGRIVPMYRNSNVPMLLNAVEMLSGGADLIAVRSRGVTKRPFTKMEQLRDQVERDYRPMIEQRTQELNKIVQDIASLGGVKQEKGVVMLNLNQDQRRELLEKQSAIQKDIRDIQKDQNRKKERVEMTITGLNLFAVPLLVIVFGIVVAVRRRSLQAAH